MFNSGHALDLPGRYLDPSIRPADAAQLRRRQTPLPAAVVLNPPESGSEAILARLRAAVASTKTPNDKANTHRHHHETAVG